MTLALAIGAGLCYFIGTSRVGSGTYHSLGVGPWIGFVCGLIYGDVATGLIIGANIELVYLGVVAPAGQIPADEVLANSVAIPLALASGMDSATAVTLAMPFALLGVFLDQLRRTSNIYWVHKADKYAAQGNERGIFITGTWCPLAVSFVLRFIPVFVLTYFGSSVVADAMQTLPAWITKALSTTGNLLPALGFGIILNTIGNRKLLPYFFIGFFAVQYLSIGTMAAAVFGTCLAVLIYFAGNAKKEAVSNG